MIVRNRSFPLRMGDWLPETAKEKMAQIEIDLIAKFGEYPLDPFDRFMLQTHVNDLALRYSQDRVKQCLQHDGDCQRTRKSCKIAGIVSGNSAAEIRTECLIY